MWAKRLPSASVEWIWDRFWAWMATPEAGNLAEWVGAVGQQAPYCWACIYSGEIGRPT